jgi:hypothetical protein
MEEHSKVSTMNDQDPITLKDLVAGLIIAIGLVVACGLSEFIAR